jgi:hypothetical protein
MSRRKPEKAADQLDAVANKTSTEDIEIIVDDENDGNDNVVVTADDDSLHAGDGDRDQGEGDGDHEDDPLTVLKAQHEAHKAELEQEKRQRAEAEARARDAENRAQVNADTARNATDVALENALIVTKQNIQNATAAIANAAARGDWEAYGRANAELAQNNAYLTDLNNKKSEFEAAPKNVRPSNDGIEQYISQRTPETQRWLRAHYDDVFLNPQKSAMAQAAHALAVAKGTVPDSKEYFDFIDSQMGYKKVETTTPPPAKPKNGAPAAPASRTTFGSPPSTKTQVRLSVKQREYAESLRPDLPAAEAWKVYAAGVAEINTGKSHLQWSKDRYK